MDRRPNSISVVRSLFLRRVERSPPPERSIIQATLSALREDDVHAVINKRVRRYSKLSWNLSRSGSFRVGHLMSVRSVNRLLCECVSLRGPHRRTKRQACDYRLPHAQILLSVVRSQIISPFILVPPRLPSFGLRMLFNRTRPVKAASIGIDRGTVGVMGGFRGTAWLAVFGRSPPAHPPRHPVFRMLERVAGDPLAPLYAGCLQRLDQYIGHLFTHKRSVRYLQNHFVVTTTTVDCGGSNDACGC